MIELTKGPTVGPTMGRSMTLAMGDQQSSRGAVDEAREGRSMTLAMERPGRR
jgi:hypothetical protein